MLTFLEDPSLKKLKNIEHRFFTRLGGVSSGIYDSLNCAYPSADKRENVEENRRRAMALLGYPLEALASVHNTHSKLAVIVEQPWELEQQPQADGMVSKRAGIILGSDSADCPIVLLADEAAGVVGLAHAGWRGALSGVIEATIDKMLFLGAKTEGISAAVSPCIAQDSYGVGFDFYQQFLAESAANQAYFKKAVKKRHFLFNLPAYVQKRLLGLGLKSVSLEAARDTYRDERFFSCRRALHQGSAYFGGHLSCITITPPN